MQFRLTFHIKLVESKIKRFPMTRRILLWGNSSGGKTAGVYRLAKLDVTVSISGVSHKFRIVRIIIPACLIKQPNCKLSRM